jgi:hypothetical protein
VFSVQFSSKKKLVDSRLKRISWSTAFECHWLHSCGKQRARRWFV